MITYFANRWAMKRKFEQTPDGWVYRHMPGDGPVPVSEEERELIISKFANHGWWNLPILFGGMTLLVLLALAASFAFPASMRGEVLAGISYPGIVALLGLVMWRWYRAYTFPLRLLAGREPAGGRVSWLEAWKVQQRSASWPLLAIRVFVYAAFAWVIFPREWPLSPMQWVILVLWTLLAIPLVAGIWIKLRGEENHRQ